MVEGRKAAEGKVEKPEKNNRQPGDFRAEAPHAGEPQNLESDPKHLGKTPSKLYELASQGMELPSTSKIRGMGDGLVKGFIDFEHNVENLAKSFFSHSEKPSDKVDANQKKSDENPTDAKITPIKVKTESFSISPADANSGFNTFTPAPATDGANVKIVTVKTKAADTPQQVSSIAQPGEVPDAIQPKRVTTVSIAPSPNDNFGPTTFQPASNFAGSENANITIVKVKPVDPAVAMSTQNVLTADTPGGAFVAGPCSLSDAPGALQPMSFDQFQAGLNQPRVNQTSSDQPDKQCVLDPSAPPLTMANMQAALRGDPPPDKPQAQQNPPPDTTMNNVMFNPTPIAYQQVPLQGGVDQQHSNSQDKQCVLDPAAPPLTFANMQATLRGDPLPDKPQAPPPASADQTMNYVMFNPTPIAYQVPQAVPQGNPNPQDKPNTQANSQCTYDPNGPPLTLRNIQAAVRGDPLPDAAPTASRPGIGSNMLDPTPLSRQSPNLLGGNAPDASGNLTSGRGPSDSGRFDPIGSTPAGRGGIGAERTGGPSTGANSFSRSVSTGFNDLPSSLPSRNLLGSGEQVASRAGNDLFKANDGTQLYVAMDSTAKLAEIAARSAQNIGNGGQAPDGQRQANSQELISRQAVDLQQKNDASRSAQDLQLALKKADDLEKVRGGQQFYVASGAPAGTESANNKTAEQIITAAGSLARVSQQAGMNAVSLDSLVPGKSGAVDKSGAGAGGDIITGPVSLSSLSGRSALSASSLDAGTIQGASGRSGSALSSGTDAIALGAAAAANASVRGLVGPGADISGANPLASGKGIFAVDLKGGTADNTIGSRTLLTAFNSTNQLNTVTGGQILHPGRIPGQPGDLTGIGGRTPILAGRIDPITGRIIPNSHLEGERKTEFELSELTRIQRSLGGRRYLTGVEIALAVAIASAAVAKSKNKSTQVLGEGEAAADSMKMLLADANLPGQSQDSSKDEDNNSSSTNNQTANLFKRPTMVIAHNDSLVEIAEKLFHNSDVAWLIADINGGRISEHLEDGKRIIELRSRQEIELPLPSEVESFLLSHNKDAKAENIVTVVAISEIDRELLNSFLSTVVGGPQVEGSANAPAATPARPVLTDVSVPVSGAVWSPGPQPVLMELANFGRSFSKSLLPTMKMLVKQGHNLKTYITGIDMLLPPPPAVHTLKPEPQR